MKKILAILFVLIFACNLVFGASITDELKGMANQLVQVKAGVSKPSYAFVALTTDYKNTLVDNYVTDALTEAMFNTGKVKIIERANVETILQEQKFQSSGLVNEETVKSIGMIAGVDFVCYGTLKDLGASLTVNARVVDVETGELCAIARTTILKDEYLQRQVQSAVGTPSIATTKTTTTTQKTTSNTINNIWKVNSGKTSKGNTWYLFRIYSTDTRFLLVGYTKCENPANDYVNAGIYWGYDNTNRFSGPTNTGRYDIKGQDGTTITKDLNDLWSWTIATNDFFYYAWDQKAGSRWLVDILVNSDTVSVRRDGLSRKFQTAGLLDKMAEYGITWEEIDNALANEEF